jgi:predicted DCC family thiol-disulfide oxidoreductase YuxK
MNAVSPAAATHEQMQRMLGKTLRRQVWLRAPAALIRTLLGEMSQLLVDGQRITPARALRSGFVFRYPNLGTALEHLLGGQQPFTQQAEIYYNGDCPVCRTEMQHYAGLCASTSPELQFIDSTQLPVEFTRCGLRREHLERRVYVRDSEGRILSGMPAIIALWQKMPRYQRLARIASWPLIKPTAVVLYDHLIAPTLFWWARTHSRRRAAAAH